MNALHDYDPNLTACSVSALRRPRSAVGSATLLMLVTLVVAHSATGVAPLAPETSAPATAERGMVRQPAGLLVRSLGRIIRLDRCQPAVSPGCSLARLDAVACPRTAGEHAGTGHNRLMDVRAGLLDLPPPGATIL